MLLGEEHCMTSNKEASIFSTWSTAVVVKGLSAFYSRWFRLCRDGVVCFFIRVSVLFSRAVRAPSEEKAHYQSQLLLCLNYDDLYITTTFLTVHEPRSAFTSCQLPVEQRYCILLHMGCLPVWTWSSIIIILLMGRWFWFFFYLHIICFLFWFPIHWCGVWKTQM